jgi:hypothetical protein
MGYTNDLLDGLAQTLAAAGVATYRPDGSAYLPSETAISFKNRPAAPDRAVVLSSYGATDNPNQALGTVTVQLWFRGTQDSRDVDNLADAAFVVLQGITHAQYGSCHAIQVIRKSTIPMGQDDSRRWERSDNYSVDVNVPPTPNRNQ